MRWPLLLILLGCGSPAAVGDACMVALAETRPGEYAFEFMVDGPTMFRECCIVAAGGESASLALLSVRRTGFTTLALESGPGEVCINPADAAFDDIVLQPDTLYRLRAYGQLAAPSVQVAGELCAELGL